MLGGDQRLQQVGRGRGRRERGQQGQGLGDRPVVPALAVLVGQQHQSPVAHARVAARVLQQHQGQQGIEVGRVARRRHHLAQHPHEPHGLAGDLGTHDIGTRARCVAGGEGEVGDLCGQVDALGETSAVRHRELRSCQALARPGQPGGHRRGRHQEEPRDVLGADAEHEPQRERRGRLGGERRMGAEEHQAQPLVHHPTVRAWIDHDLLRLVAEIGLDGQQGELAGGDRLRAESVEDASSGGGEHPRGGVVGHAVGRPGARSRLDGVAEAVLGEVEASVAGDEQGQQPAPLVAQQELELAQRWRHMSGTGRTSTDGTGRRPASSTATSSEGRSTR
ncbi:unannotated protein [freshwater metagenome]|uniref:Unannotated protein n=1 Tax=freshwater metagenome TaxID=449393 RepID=A0A6J6RGV4_9ZZZZ